MEITASRRLPQFFADGLVRGGGAEKHAVRHDAGAAAADLEHPQEQRKEQQLRLLCLADLQKIGGDDIRVQTALEGGIGQNEAVLLPIRVLVGETVAVLDKGVIHAVGHHVHGPDAQHGAVHVVAVEHVVHIVVLVLAVEEDLLFAVFLEIIADRHEEAGGAAGRVADDIVGLRLHQLHHHADDVPGRAELAVDACRGDLREQILIHVAAGIGGLEGGHLLIDAIHGRDDLVQHQRRGDFENGVAHVFGVGAFLITVQVLDKGEDPLLHGAVHLCRREVVEHAPFELAAVDSTVPDLHLLGEDARIGQTQHGGLACAEVVGVIQIVNEHQIGHLLDHIQRIRQTARPENLPEAVDFASQFACNHVLTPFPNSTCKRYSVLHQS